MKKILITGASGFIGSHLARTLSRRDRVHVWLRPTSNTWRLRDVLSNVRVHYVDITDSAAVWSSIGEVKPDVIYHTANVGVYAGIPTSSLMDAVNRVGFTNLIEAASATSCSAFINIGSVSEYGPKNTPMSEDDVCEPVTEYGRSKLAATLAAVQLGESGFPIATFRLFSPYGPFDDERRIIAKTILSIASGTMMWLPSERLVRDYLFVEDAIDFLAEVSGHIKYHAGEIFNLSGGAEIRAIDVMREIAREMGKEISWPKKDVPLEAESPTVQADMSKTFSAFPWRPKVPLETGITKTIDWFVREYPAIRPAHSR
ncbi:NAD(P)-dependent oxidoreductase [Candidatus Kaiserbacteria bacterium]|nr:NAD(P)-dependent oxidoreductase [Candidatus Kaiserbacteria bacterium]